MNIWDLQSSLSTMSKDSLNATLDAITDILQSRSVSGTGMPPDIQLPPDIWQEIEPRLHKPKQQNNNSNNNNQQNIKIDDPDNLLNKNKPDNQNNQDKPDNQNNQNNQDKPDNQNNQDNQDKPDNQNNQDNLYDTTDIDNKNDNDFKDAAQQKAEAADLLDKKATLDRLNDLLNTALDKAKQAGDSLKQQELLDVKNILDNLINLTDKELLETSKATIDSVEESVLNATKDIEKVEQQSADEIQKNITKIQDLENDPLEQQALETELEDNKELDPIAIQAARLERQKRQAMAASQGDNKMIKTPTTFTDFKKDLVNTIDAYVDEIEQEERETLMNSDLADQEDYFRPIMQTYDIERKEKPIVIAYIDTSGSWDKSDIKKAEDAVKQLSYYDDVEDLIELHIKYEGGYISNTAAGSIDYFWPSNWNGMMEDIKCYKGNVNVVLFLDDDVYVSRVNKGKITAADWAKKGGLKVNGHVWFVWKNKGSFDRAAMKGNIENAISGPNSSYNTHYVFE